jgi:hypothetical protein
MRTCGNLRNLREGFDRRDLVRHVACSERPEILFTAFHVSLLANKAAAKRSERRLNRNM